MLVCFYIVLFRGLVELYSHELKLTQNVNKLIGFFPLFIYIIDLLSRLESAHSWNQITIQYL